VTRYLAVFAALAAVLLAAFAVVEAIGVPLLTDPEPVLARGGVLAGVVGVGLLIGDVALPVPSSVIMITHGTLFGVVVGASLSLVGTTGAALAGFAVGRRGGRLLHRVVPRHELERAEQLLDRWGLLAIVATRPVPIVAESVAVMAGASQVPISTVLAGAVVGALPAAVLYAVAGAVAASFVDGALVFVGVVAVAAVTWAVGRLRIMRSREPVSP
jgi:uncharacterized membrane protein YdjX (TVP38/TMEM64 family)